jgi:hypothetical protein
MTISRAEGFLGVMVDDLVSRGAEEPCEFGFSITFSYRARLLTSHFFSFAKTGCSLPGVNTG